MKVTARSRRQLRLENLAFVLLFLAAVGLLAWLSTRYTFQADWTAAQRNSLSKASSELLAKLDGPVAITAYARTAPPQLRKAITDLVARYQRRKPDISLQFVNPDLDPQRVRDLNITVDGEMVITYRGRSEHLQDRSESGLTNALQRVARGAERRVLFLQGHGERKPHDNASFELGAWVKELEAKGVSVGEINLAETPRIPTDTAVLVIASPQGSLLPGEMAALQAYLARGGGLLWLADPDRLRGFAPLAEALGIVFNPGFVVDPNVSQAGMMLFGTDDPRVALVATYPSHAITRGFTMNTLFPIAGSMTWHAQDHWEVEPILKTLSNTWSETGEARGQVTYDEGVDVKGPLTIGVALTRALPHDVVSEKGAPDSEHTAPQQNADRVSADSDSDPDNGQDAKRDSGQAAPTIQRAVVIADGDFLSNGFLGLGGNLQLGVNIINWLSADDEFVTIPARTVPDATLQLSPTASVLIVAGFLIVMPVLLLGAGVTVWYRRRRR